MRRSVLLFALVALSGCATVINKPTQKIPVSSDPAGAVVSIDCGSVPIYGGLTPVTIELPRGEEDCSITLGKEGYAETVVHFEQQLSRVTAANSVPGVVVGTFTGLVAVLLEWEGGAMDGEFIADAYRVGHTLGSMPGNAIDRKSGAAYKHVPGEVFVTLVPATP
jgi:hypothetical protein